MTSISFRHLAICAIRVAVFVTLLVPSNAQNVPSGFVLEVLAQNPSTEPVDFSLLPDGRALIADRGGDIRVWAGGAAVVVGTVPAVESLHERGLLSIEADPNFATNGHVFVYYASAADDFLHLDRFRLLGDLANPTSTNLTLDVGSRRVILDSVPDLHMPHNGGSVRFGADNLLYLSVGDDSTDCASQDLTSPLGKILRLDVLGLPASGSIVAPAYGSLNPGTNPLSANQDISQLFVAMGLRNPFRMEVDRLTGSLYVGDVGGGVTEEVDEYQVGPGADPLRNYGWPWREGSVVHPGACSGSAPTPVVGPIVEAPHALGWTCLIQGPRYRNLGGVYDFGPAYEGVVFSVDYYRHHVRCVAETAGWAALPPVAGQPNATDWATDIWNVTAMRQGADGAIYLTQNVAWWAGFFARLRPAAVPPSIAARSGSGQVAVANEAFGTPLTVRVADSGGAPQVGVPVDFSVFGPASLSSSGPVLTDSQGEARTLVTAANAGGAITVNATSPVSLGNATFSLFSRKMSVAHTSSLAVVTINNMTNAIPAQVPYVVMVALPGAAPWNSPFGSVCTDPSSPLTIVIEDGLGVFGGFSLSGAGSIGSPRLTRVYQLVPGLLNGLQLNFQAIGLDPIEGFFRTDCVATQF